MLSSCYSKMTNHSGCEKMMKKGRGAGGLRSFCLIRFTLKAMELMMKSSF